MNLKEIFRKQGGFELIKQYYRGGALFTACVEFILLGKKKKALEILRLSAEYKTKRKLEKKYYNKLVKAEKLYDSTAEKIKSDYVWICWFQGLENAPDLVKKCIQSVKDNLRDRTIVIITENNMYDYVKLPNYIIDKWKKGIITYTHMTDILRLELLLNYGGTWIDATVLCTDKSENIPNYFFDSELFFFQTLKPGRDGISTFVSSWFISAWTNNKVLWLTRELLYNYWKESNCMVNYFLLHYFLCMVLEYCKDEWDKMIPRDNSTPHILLLRLFDTYDKKMYQAITEQTPFHKLSYKFSPEELKKESTFYQILMKEDID